MLKLGNNKKKESDCFGFYIYSNHSLELMIPHPFVANLVNNFNEVISSVLACRCTQIIESFQTVCRTVI